jgi:phospholipase C
MKSTLRVLSLLAAAGLAATSVHAATPFKHVIVIFQENRTPDNLFQGLCTANHSKPGCGTLPTQYDIVDTYMNSKGASEKLLPIGLANNFDLDHSHGGPDLNGTTSGWAFEYLHQGLTGALGENVPPLCGTNIFGCTGPTSSQFMYVYNSPVTNSDGSKGALLDPYITLATTYGWGNQMYQTNQGPSYPAHQFIFGATSAPSMADDAAGIFVAENTGSSTYGCASGTSAQLIRPNGSSTFPFGTETSGDVTTECFTRNAMDYLFGMAAPRITWTYYAAGQSSLWVAPNSLSNICTVSGGVCTGPDWTKGATNGYVDTFAPDVLNDISGCTLPQVSWVTPGGAYSDHAHANQGQGPSWVASIVNAIGNNTTCDSTGYWKDTLIIVTWDDWGGWYDHVPPVFQTGANQNDYQLGFRVPLVVVSAYSPGVGVISNLPYDFGSILKTIEGVFGLGSLGFADARAANDLSAFFNVSMSPTKYKTIPSPLDAAYFTALPKGAIDPPDND